jgi:hypothetical protein
MESDRDGAFALGDTDDDLDEPPPAMGARMAIPPV